MSGDGAKKKVTTKRKPAISSQTESSDEEFGATNTVIKKPKKAAAAGSSDDEFSATKTVAKKPKKAAAKASSDDDFGVTKPAAKKAKKISAAESSDDEFGVPKTVAKKSHKVAGAAGSKKKAIAKKASHKGDGSSDDELPGFGSKVFILEYILNCRSNNECVSAISNALTKSLF